MTDRYAVIGYPLGHTISPAFQQAAFDHLNIDARYEAIETPPDQLSHRLDELRSGRLSGLNVTIPHKTGIVAGLDRVTDTARLTGAVNTVTATGDGLEGDNTDVAAIEEVLNRSNVPTGIDCLLVGAGGAARAAIVALSRRGDTVTVANRTLSRAEQIVRELAPDYGFSTIALDSPSLTALARDSRLIVNTTSIGMQGGPAPHRSPLPDEAFHAGQTVFDIVYRPATTPLLAGAARAGAECLGGLEMLILQGAHSFQIWTGREPPFDIMLAAGRQALEAS